MLRNLKPLHYAIAAFVSAILLVSLAMILSGNDDAPTSGDNAASSNLAQATGTAVVSPTSPATATAAASPSPVPVESQSTPTTEPTLEPTHTPSIADEIAASPDVSSAVNATVRLDLQACFDSVSLAYGLYYAFPWNSVGSDLFQGETALTTITTSAGVLDVSGASVDVSAARTHLLDARYPDGLLLEVYFDDTDSETFARWMQTAVDGDTGIVIEPKPVGSGFSADNCAAQLPSMFAKVDYASASVAPPSLPPTSIPASLAIDIEALPQRSYVGPDGSVNALHDFALSEPFEGDSATGISVTGLPKPSSNGLQSWEVGPGGATITIVIGPGVPAGTYEFVATFADGRSASVLFQHE